MKLWNFAFSPHWRTGFRISAVLVFVLSLYGLFSGSIFWMIFPVLSILVIGLFEDAIKAVAYKYYSCKVKNNA
jgi:hypothetical protein